ncbi:hypothetical protein O181_129267 [Austropuccinia psidii MF-1]|uniref:Uncharacterized protein n=1 Tax=Austropuccinia psidii MF-1 TaxID=1389203 RepID=A0A9Q3QBB0_9BASI|nr:hypothetical protein [Austropuccinia psidii MF-1]
MVRKENIETASTDTSITPASTVNSYHDRTVILTQNYQPEPVSSYLISLDISNTLQNANTLSKIKYLRQKYYFKLFLMIIMPLTRSGAIYSPSRSSQKGYRCDYRRSQSVTEGQGAETSTRCLCGHLQSQPEGLQQFLAAQRVPDPCSSVEKLHEFLPECEQISGPSQHLQVTQWMAFIDGKEIDDAFNGIMKDKQPSTTQTSSKTSPNSQNQKLQCKKASSSSGKGKRQGTSQGYRIPKIHQDAMGNVFQMARAIMELQKREEAILKYQK